MARRIAGAGFELAVWNRSPEKAEELARATAARVAVSPAGAARDAQVIVTCLPTSGEVEAVTFGADGLASTMSRGSILVDCTSGDPHASRAIAQRLADLGIDFLDAPVSGGVVGAEAGKLTVMCGGAAAVVERARPVIQAFGAKIILCGPTGAGHAIKALSNALLAIHLWSTGEVLVAAAKAGVSPSIALDVINGSAGRSNSSENLIPQRVLTREFPRTFRLALLDKDVRIAESVARESGTPAQFIELAHALFERAHSELGDEVDHTAALQLLERETGIQIK
jgi:3-hydroxyisobutyrate dehydrogenase